MKLQMLVNWGVQADGSIWLEKGKEYEVNDEHARFLLAANKARPGGYDPNDISTMFAEHEKVAKPRRSRKKVSD